MDLTGWKVDDSSESPVAALPLNGVGILAPGESAIFIEAATPVTTIATFLSNWFGANPPAGLQVGSYTGSSIGLSTNSDAVNLYDTSNVRRANVSFGASPTAAPFATFDNAMGINVGAITKLSVPGLNGAFVAKGSPNEIGSPGIVSNGGLINLSQWLEANGFGSSTADSDSDGVANILEFAFGLDPRGSDNGFTDTNISTGVLVSRGLPTTYSQATPNGQDFRVVFLRRKDAQGLIYTPQFSSDLVTWEDSPSLPIVVATDSEMEAVTIPYPFFVNGKKAQFFRVAVTAAP